ncbi:type II toxin-antitoxin system VapB family antitoxin [Mariniradius sediminis]|uniref:Type II toxin-antitoxin system VapB family antitoxin n=1 Tax=Mariniradius sediminis TaxID=2909237 RepID=A0ABS9BSN2_9BACT|nr:type II toxin-antitoxin system VapB family antitoxin [Mariniradius sediminis]MCF1750697.1 type II toxin-antitoxin system VapB family antitoxin [Mariniradius sediminis]
MRTTIDIPKELIEEAMLLTGAKTKNQLIQDALEEKIKSIRRKQLITMKGTIDLGIDLDILRDRK